MGNLSEQQVEEHYREAAKNADLVHQADPEIILQAGVFEIIYRGTVESQKIPEWVFADFDLPVEDRHFDWEKMCFPEDFAFQDAYMDGWGSRDYWNKEASWPFIGSIETQMYFYYCICRYIDAGFEAVHLGQAEKDTGGQWEFYSGWDRVTTLARSYAKKHARRGIVLFDLSLIHI